MNSAVPRPPSRLRILFIAREYPPNMGWGGIGTYVATMATALAERRHDVHVLSCVENQVPQDYMDRGVHVHERRGIVAFRGFGRIHRTLRRFGMSRTVARFTRGLGAYYEYRQLGLRCDVVEYTDWAAMGWAFACVHDAALVAHFHTPPPTAPILDHYEILWNRDMRWASRLVRFSLRRADAITCPSRVLVNGLESLGWLRNRNASVIPNPIDAGKWGHVQSVRDTQPIVLFLGRLERIKAPEILVEALSIIRAHLPVARALFVGSTGVREGVPYIDWLKRSGLDTAGCEFFGDIPRDALIQVFTRSRVLAVPSWYDTYPCVVLEAMASARPVVVTTTTGTVDFVRHTGGGDVVAAGDARGLAEALLPFLQDAAYAADIGDRGRSAVHATLDANIVAVQRETLYRQAIASFKRR
jgi:glycogen synthase